MKPHLPLLILGLTAAGIIAVVGSLIASGVHDRAEGKEREALTRQLRREADEAAHVCEIVREIGEHDDITRAGIKARYESAMALHNKYQEANRIIVESQLRDLRDAPVTGRTLELRAELAKIDADRDKIAAAREAELKALSARNSEELAKREAEARR